MNYAQYQNQCAWQKHMQMYPQQGLVNSLFPTAANPTNHTTPTSAVPTSKRRTRTVFNPQSITYLESEFNHNAYPDYEARCHYAQLLHVSEDRIQVWFQNKRSRSRGKKLNRGSPPSAKTSPMNVSQTSWLGSAANSPMSSSDSSAISMSSQDLSLPLQQSTGMISPGQQNARTNTPATHQPIDTIPPPAQHHRRQTTVIYPAQQQHQTTHPAVQQSCIQTTSRPCKRVLNTSDEPAVKRHRPTTTPDDDIALCDLVIDLSPESAARTSNSLSLSLSQHVTSHQDGSTFNNHSTIDSNISAEDVFTQPIPQKQAQSKPLQLTQQRTPDSHVFQFPTPNSSQSPSLTSTAKNSKRRPSSLRLDSLELPLSTPCPSFFNGLSPLWNVPFSPLYIPSPRLMLSKHLD